MHTAGRSHSSRLRLRAASLYVMCCLSLLFVPGQCTLVSPSRSTRVPSELRIDVLLNFNELPAPLG